METPTARQGAILIAIGALVERHGYSPTIHELSEQLGLRSKGGAASQVKALGKKGFLTLTVGKARSIVITPAGIAWLASKEQEHGQECDAGSHEGGDPPEEPSEAGTDGAR